MLDSNNTYGERVSRLVGWGHWFSLFNILAALLIGTRYISESPWPNTLLGQTYLFISWIGHFSFLVFALYLLILFPLTFVVFSRRLFRFIAVCFATVGLTLLLIDTQAYRSIHLHITPVVWQLLFSTEKSSVSAELQNLFVVLPIIFLLQLALSEWVWHKQRQFAHKHIGRPLAALFFLSFIASHLIYVWSDANLYASVTNQKTNFPLSYPMTAKSFMEKHGFLDREEYLKRSQENEYSQDIVSYPLEPITFNRRGANLNVLMISVNNWRADTLSAQQMPNTYAFASKNSIFSQHYSSSNDIYGVFGLFYGLTSNYANNIAAQGTKPLFLSIMQNQQYKLSFFSGDDELDPLYTDIIFKGLDIIDNNTVLTKNNDDKAIARWQDWVTTLGSQRPWFSYLELATLDRFDIYDHDPKANISDNFKTAYSSSVMETDLKLKKIFTQLQTTGMLEHTIVIITSNHGTEFNETKSNSWGSSTNYSQYQLKVPMIIHWPGKSATVYNNRTSHLDVAATLMQDLLGVSSHTNNFSSGQNLFDETPRKWLLAGNTNEIALITAQQTTVIDKSGNFKLYDQDYKRIKHENPKLPTLMQGLTELKRFYAKD